LAVAVTLLPVELVYLLPQSSSDRPAQRELLELVRTYHQICTPGLRKQLHAIARILADGDEGQVLPGETAYD
jgi:hypothetical protein